jgi:hypothetical protein
LCQNLNPLKVGYMSWMTVERLFGQRSKRPKLNENDLTIVTELMIPRSPGVFSWATGPR